MNRLTAIFIAAALLSTMPAAEGSSPQKTYSFPDGKYCGELSGRILRHGQGMLETSEFTSAGNW